MLNQPDAVLDGLRIAGRDGFWRLAVADGRIAALAPSAATGGGLLLPLLADAHVHLDKTFTRDRLSARPSTLFEAIDLMAADRAGWSERDLRARAGRALQSAWANGVGVMRSHVDWNEPAAPLAWSVLNELKQEWRGSVELQLASLTPLDLLAEAGPAIARRVAADGGVLGAFVYRNADADRKIARVFDLAETAGLHLDFHVDEGLEPEARGFDAIVAETAGRGFAGRVLCGHGCALSVRPADEVHAVLARGGEAGLGLTVLPTTNAWLQDAAPGRTPRLRGLAPLHEARAAGVDILIASDNVQDGFYPYGSYDPLEAYRAVVLSGHLDPTRWLAGITGAAAAWCGVSLAVAAGRSADFIWFDATDMDDLISHPRAARRVWRRGRPLTDTAQKGPT
ncbi:amidohydrolase family protein [Aquibium sp. A9E412]|uniref:amidohydrolase family protein n=1 Tax=Aquibium sp. A9E412 TaxID=2976767 RepID=UPI0025AF2344|nr:amidohydrolase family protein [Aquibium sp. A9E412]MDN2564601.1 amidohydrolase family protein [Aquibium sp. A9E412]